MLVAQQPADHPFVRSITSGHPFAAYGGSVWDVEAMHAAGVALVHLHFGFEHLDTAVVRGWTTALADAGIALVHTVHDLDNPHLVDQSVFHRTVVTLVGAAGAVTTLTPTSATVLAARHGVDVTVIPHPRVVPSSDVARRLGRARSGVYVHAAAGRPNFCLDTVDRLVARPDRPSVCVHVRPRAPGHVRHRLDRLAARGRIHLDVRDRLSDVELWDRLAGAELVVLPYRWGTHSGLLEAAHDLGTPVLAPAFGGYGDQGATTFDDDPAPRVAEASARCPGVTPASRRRQQHQAALAYDEAYRVAMSRMAA